MLKFWGVFRRHLGNCEIGWYPCDFECLTDDKKIKQIVLYFSALFRLFNSNSFERISRNWSQYSGIFLFWWRIFLHTYFHFYRSIFVFHINNKRFNEYTNDCNFLYSKLNQLNSFQIYIRYSTEWKLHVGVKKCFFNLK